MLSDTRQALEAFDNQHDFERLAADVLNELGHSGVEPMAPGGGPDGGQDIRFWEGRARGVAFVSLETRIRERFKADLSKQQPAVESVIALFCHVDVSPAMKMDLTKEAIQKGFRLEVFDLERLRSLLDSSLRLVRRRYLNIDDEVAARIRSEVLKLLRFPDGVADSPPQTFLESVAVDQVPRGLFDLLMRYDEGDVREVPGLGAPLHEHLIAYHELRHKTRELEEHLTLAIGKLSVTEVPAGWRIYLRYVLFRFGGQPLDAIKSGGLFLNYGIGWQDAEKCYEALAADSVVAADVASVFDLYTRVHEGAKVLAKEVRAE